MDRGDAATAKMKQRRFMGSILPDCAFKRPLRIFPRLRDWDCFGVGINVPFLVHDWKCGDEWRTGKSRKCRCGFIGPTQAGNRCSNDCVAWIRKTGKPLDWTSCACSSAGLLVCRLSET
jgi:hypothetical protein